MKKIVCLLSSFILIILLNSIVGGYNEGEVVLGNDQDELIIESQDDDLKMIPQDEKEIPKDSVNNVNPTENLIEPSELDQRIDKIIDESVKKFKIELSNKIKQEIKKEVVVTLNIKLKSDKKLNIKEIQIQVNRSIRNKLDKMKEIKTPKIEKAESTIAEIPYIKIGSDHPTNELINNDKQLQIHVTLSSKSIRNGVLQLWAVNVKDSKKYLFHNSKIYFQIKNNWYQKTLAWNGTYINKKNKKLELPSGKYKIYCIFVFINPTTKKINQVGRYWGRDLSDFYITVQK